MLAEERFSVILHLLEEQRAVTVVQLAQTLKASESTIRRDLQTLAQQGRVNKVHGGAVLCHPCNDVLEPALRKEDARKQQKERIARYAAAQIHPEDVVFLDAGTTTLEMIAHLDATSTALFVTRGLAHAQKLAQRGLRVYLPGGLIKTGTESIVGTAALHSLSQYHFTKAFLGVNGIDLKQGFTTPDPEEGLLKAVAIQQSYMSYVLADSSKFNRVSAATVATLDKACIITDRLEDARYAQHAVIKQVDCDRKPDASI